MVDVRAKDTTFVSTNIRDILNELLSYDPTTGIFTYKKLRGPRKAGSIAGSINSNGYVVLSINTIRYRAHRVAWLIYYGEWPKSELDHVNRIKSDNRIDNLREVTTAQNGYNRIIRSSPNKTGFMGVSKRGNNRFVANIQINKSNKYLGSFKTAEEASTAYQLAFSKIKEEPIV